MFATWVLAAAVAGEALQPVPVDPAAVQRAARVARLADDLDRVELDLIRGELNRLEKADGFTAGTAAAFDLLFDRLHRLRAGPVAPAAARAEEELARLEVELIAKEVERAAKARALTPETVEQLDRLRMRLREIPFRMRVLEPVPIPDGPFVPAPPRVDPPGPPPQPLPPPQLFPGS